MSFWSGWGWPAATAVIGFVYVGLLLAQWNRRRKPHQLAWAVGFTFYAVAAAMEFISEYTQHWDPTVYRIYIVLAASMVGFLGLGTMYLVSKRRVLPTLFLVYVLGCLAVFFYGTFTTPLLMDALKPGIVVGGAALGSGGSFPRIMSLFFNIPGTLLLVGGSLYSIILFSKNPAYRYRVWANVLIIVGTLMIAAAGTMARAGTTQGLYAGEMVASGVLLAGFLVAGTLERGSKTAVTESRAQRAASEPGEA